VADARRAAAGSRVGPHRASGGSSGGHDRQGRHAPPDGAALLAQRIGDRQGARVRR
jgi:hypothetical protein